MPLLILLILCIGAVQSWLMWFAPLPNAIEVQQQGQDVRIELVEPYQGEFRVLGTQRYPLGLEHYFFVGDAFDRVSGLDLALGWGEMSKPDIYQTVQIRQSNRWYYFQLTADTPLGVDEIGRQSANTHMVAANAAIAKQLNQIDVHDLVLLKGQLVNLYAADGRVMKTSLSREDRGAGACEIFLVEQVIWKQRG